MHGVDFFTVGMICDWPFSEVSKEMGFRVDHWDLLG